MPTGDSFRDLTAPGRFVVGCNYWASHAGAAMWRDWRPDVVARDFSLLAAARLQVLRVFPLWPDFQPLALLRGSHGHPREYRFGEAPLPDTEAGRDGMSAVALGRFAEFADLAEKHGLKLIVGLITGWMSGRLFVPPALEGLNLITDPEALMWQTRFVRHLVRRFKAHPAVAAWDLGNECNCLGPAPSRAAAWAWTAALTHAIKAEDRTHPVVSGMHSLMPEPALSGNWLIQDQAELNDLLTTHPYPYWCRHTAQDPVCALRTTLHAAAESRLYADVGGKPCLAEEIGTMGPMVSDDAAAARFTRTNLFSLWANDCHGFLWWCAFDQTELAAAPYDWTGVERELGLIRSDGTAKPMLAELTRFREFLTGLSIAELPPRRAEAVCILTRGQDQWGAAYSSFILAKQAKLELAFQYVDQPLRDAPLYLLPSVATAEPIPRRRWLELLEKVKAGAALYLSLDGGIVSPFNDVFGADIASRSTRTGESRVTLGGLDGAPVVTAGGGHKLAITPRRAAVLGTDETGNPAFLKADYGRGTAYLLAWPLEMQLTRTPGVFDDPAARPYWRIYRELAAAIPSARALRVAAPTVAATEHELDGHRRIAVLINHAPAETAVSAVPAAGWELGAVLYGAARPSRREASGECEFRIPGNDALVLELERRPAPRQNPNPNPSPNHEETVP
ncbi:MAG: glycoside hydrolase family 2 TIM barrel-domain containing protein [Lentisphaeria bacterium]